MIAIYARVSTEEQALHGASLETQVAACRAHVGPTDELIQEFIDGGVSGIILERPQLTALRNAAERGDLHRLIILDPDRLSRKLVHQLLLTEEFERRGVILEFVNFEWQQTPEGRLFYSLRGAISEFEREKIRERTRRGWLAKAHGGQLVAGMQRYGYLYDASTKTLTIDPATAPIVQEIFRLAVEEHLSTGKIAQTLAQRQIAPPRGKVWWRDTVSKILRNLAYTGIAYVHRYDSVRHNRERNEDEWIAIEVPALIPAAQWVQARDVIYHYQKIWKGRQEVPMLLRRLVYCGVCGHMMSTNIRTINKTTYRYYFCSHRYARKFTTAPTVPDESKCTLPWIPAEPLEEAVWKDVVAVIDDPEGWRTAQAAPDKGQTGPSEEEHVARELQKVQRSRHRLLELVRKDLITLEDAERDLKALKSEEQRLRERQTALQNLQPSLATLIADVRARMGPHLDALPFTTRQDIVQRLIDKITVSVGDDGAVNAVIQFLGEPAKPHES